MPQVDLTFNGVDSGRASLQIDALRGSIMMVTGSRETVGPTIRLERRSSVHIVRRGRVGASSSETTVMG